jgi:WD40 repeat protein/serine/threonine protein kinase
MKPPADDRTGTWAPRQAAASASASALDDPRVFRAMEEYAAAMQAGRKPDRQTFLARHPEIAEALAECLDGLEFVCTAAPELSQAGAARSASPADDVQPATPLGDYQVVREVGRGGMGVVYEAVQLSLGRRVALKVLPFAAALDPKQLQRFKNEAQAAAHLHHQHIVPVYAVGCERGVHYYAMQFIEGQTLAALIRERRQQAGKEHPEPKAPVEGTTLEDRGPNNATRPTLLRSSILDPPDSYFRIVATLGVQAAEALEHAHQQGVVHRDIKPANLLLEGRAGGVSPLLWITDFGLARLQGDAGLTMSGDLLGTLRYMSPEQALGKGNLVDPRTDIYSLGATLYELLTLEPAYRGSDRQEVLRQIAEDEPSPPRRLNPAIPAELETIVLKAMSKSADERYASAQELADDLRRHLEDKPIRARRPTLRQRARKWARRHRAVVRSAAVILALAVLALASSTALVWQANDRLGHALGREQRVAYYHGISLAEREWSAGNLSRADQLLDDCPVSLRGWEWHYVKGLRRGSWPPLRGHTGPVWSVAVSPDGRHLVSSSFDHTVKVWNAATAQVLYSREGSDNIIWPMISVAFSPDGHLFASVGTPCTCVKLWETATGREVRTLRSLDHPVHCLAFSPDGRRLAGAIPQAHAARIWDVETGEELLTLRHEDYVNYVAFSPDGHRLASAGRDRIVRVWEVATGQELLVLRGSPRGIGRVTFSPDGTLLASAVGGWWFRGDEGEVTIWDATTGRPLRTLSGHMSYVFSMAFSPDGRRLATAGGDHSVKIWDTATGEEALTLRGHTDMVFGVAFGPDGRRLVSCSFDETIRIWDATPLEDRPDPALRTWRHHTGRVTGVAFSPDGRCVASAGEDRTVRITDALTGQELHALTGHAQHVNKVAFSPDGHVASAGLDKVIKVWDTQTGREGFSLDQGSMGHHVAYSSDGKRLATAHWDGMAKVWDASTGKQLLELGGHANAFFSVAFSPDDRYLASGSVDRTIRIWDLATGERIHTLEGHTGPVTSVAFSPDGRRLASAGRDETLRIWDVRDGRNLVTIRGHVGPVWCVAYSPDGKYLASAGNDGVIRLWDAATGSEHSALAGHTRCVESIAYSPDGKFLASASWDGTVKIWRTPP